MATVRVQKLLELAVELGPEERAELVDELLRGIPENASQVVTPDEWEAAWADEIDARLEAHRAGSSSKQDLGAFLETLAAKR